MPPPSAFLRDPTPPYPGSPLPLWPENYTDTDNPVAFIPTDPDTAGLDPLQVEFDYWKQNQPPPPPPPNPKKQPPPKAVPFDPCAQKNLFVQNTQTPPATGDWETELNNIDRYSGGTPALNQQWTAVMTERALGDLMSDPTNFSPSIQTEIESIVASLPSGMDPTDFAKAIVASLLYMDPTQVNLSPALVAVIGYIANNPNDPTINWAGLANYVNNQAFADAAALQVAKIKQMMKADNIIYTLPCDQDEQAFLLLQSKANEYQTNANQSLQEPCPNCPGATQNQTAPPGCAGLDPTDTTAQLPPGFPYSAEIYAAAKAYGINPLLLAAIGAQESQMGNTLVHSSNPKTNGTGDYGQGRGIWQLDDTQAKKPPLSLTEAQLVDAQTDPAFCAMQAAKLLAFKIGSTNYEQNQNLTAVILGYNGGGQGTPQKDPDKVYRYYTQSVCYYLQNLQYWDNNPAYVA